MEASVDVDGLLHAILTCLTAGPGLAFNRAVLFLPDDEGHALVAAMAIGPATPEEAHATWVRLASEHKTLDELLRARESESRRTGIWSLVHGLSIPMDEPMVRSTSLAAPSTTAVVPQNPMVEAFRRRHIRKVADPAAFAQLPPRLREVFGGTEMVCVPLPVKDRAAGLIVADNAFTREPISDESIRLLELLALLAGLALDNARIYKEVESQAQELRTALDQLKTTQDKLLHSERLATVGAVVAHVSHEIRNPLATIGGFARTLGARPDDPARVTRAAGIIVEEVEKLESLLKEMLDFTSPRPPALQMTDLNRVLSGLAEVRRDELGERGVALALDLAPDVPVLPADAYQLERAFLNLWYNALQAMDEVNGERARRLTVRSWREGASARVAFTDTGNGISPDVLPHIFTPFFTTKQRGTGLGLAAVRKIIEDHGGNINVESNRPGGTSFVVSLPIGREP